MTRLPDRAVVDVEVRDGRVYRLARVADAVDARGAEAVDGRGLFLLPGLEDAHVHMVQWATSRQRIDLAPATSAAHAAELVRLALDRRAQEPGEVAIGFGFRDALWADVPSAPLLAAATGPRPVLLQSNDLHTAWLNPAALQLLGRGPDEGVLREGDCYAAVAALTGLAPGAEDRLAVAATAAAAARGVTSILDFEYADTLTDWSRRAGAHQLSTRVTCVVPAYLAAEVAERGLRSGDVLTEGWLRVGPVKLFADGSLNSRTAWCHDTYPAEEHGGAHHGQEVLGPAELLALARSFVPQGLLPAVHAIGDAAVAAALDVFDVLGCGGRIEHAQLVAAQDLPRFARPGLVVGVQPAHAPDDRDVADRHWTGRTHRAYPYADLLTAGARLRIGSDAPNAALDPWDGIASAVSRTDDERAPWHPEQHIPLAAALAAAAGGRTWVRTGDPADLVLLEQDPWVLSPADLRRMPVMATMTAGRWTHRAPALRVQDASPAVNAS